MGPIENHTGGTATKGSSKVLLHGNEEERHRPGSDQAGQRVSVLLRPNCVRLREHARRERFPNVTGIHSVEIAATIASTWATLDDRKLDRNKVF